MEVFNLQLYLLGSFIISQYIMFVCVFEVFAMTHQCCDNHQGQFAIMFREDSQIDFAKENVILNISLRPPPPSVCTVHFKTGNQFKMC